VLDFGISKVSAAEGQLNPRLTRTGAVMGTPYYMSPEQIRGAEIDQRTDVYAFGVILYEALTGRVPFNAETYSALVLEIATASPRRPRELRPQLPRGLEEVVLRAMARDAEQRYPTVDAMARALETFADDVAFRIDRADPGGSMRDTATPFAAEAAVTVPVRRGSLGLVAGGALLLLGGLLWALMSASEDPVPGAVNVAKPAPAAASAGAAQPAPEAQEPGLAGGRAMQPAPIAQQEQPPAAPAAEPGAATLPAPSPTAPAAPEAKPPAGSPRGHHAPASEPAGSTRPPRPAARPNGRTGGLRSDEF
jgi:serine/threonine-protein kinase